MTSRVIQCVNITVVFVGFWNMLKFLKLWIVLFLYQNIALAEKVDLIIIDIDGIGLNSLTEIKNHDDIQWWVEMGDKMVVSAMPDVELPDHFKTLKVIHDLDTDDLAFQTLGHCDHSEHDQSLHNAVDVVFTNHSSQIINTKKFVNKQQLYGHDAIKAFQKNSTLVYQYKNHFPSGGNSIDAQTQILVNSVDKNRWYEQVELLSSLDRMEDEDLKRAGQWLEDKFAALGLSTSRLTLHPSYPGFNVLGFKQGTKRPDDWYVVGAHLDSRNRTWDQSLPSPGAEDNASGCSGVLEVANVISQYETEASIFFMCFIAEERGLLGSADVITQLTRDDDLGKIKTMLNMDMISYRLNDRNIAIAVTNRLSYQGLANSVAANGMLYSDIDWQVSTNMCCTDFVSFSQAGIPAVTSNQPDIGTYFGYHTVNDLAENLDRDLGSGVVKANLATLIDLVKIDFDSVDIIFANQFE